MTVPVPIAGPLEAFFMDRLLRERHVSPHTVAAYRDTFRLLLGFVQQRLKKAPSALTVTDLDAPLIGSSSLSQPGVWEKGREVRELAIVVPGIM